MPKSLSFEYDVSVTEIRKVMGSSFIGKNTYFTKTCEEFRLGRDGRAFEGIKIAIE